VAHEMVRRQAMRLAKVLVLFLALWWASIAWHSNGIQVQVWGCAWPLAGLPGQCVVAARSTETTTIFLNRAPPRAPPWCGQRSARLDQAFAPGDGAALGDVAQVPPGLARECRALDRAGPALLATAQEQPAQKAPAQAPSKGGLSEGALPGGGAPVASAAPVLDSSAKTRRLCAEWKYACEGQQRGQPGSKVRGADRAGSGKRSNVTVWYHHFHKAGGSTFVKLAQANGAGLAPYNSNGNPLAGPAPGAERVPFWEWAPSAQVGWAQKLRRAHGADMVVTEFGFPGPANLVAPGPFLYVTILREPVSRLVSNFFWRYRRFFSGEPEPRLAPGQAPNFQDFARKHVDFYVHTLAGRGEARGEADKPPLGEADLARAKETLEFGFSLVLICEWLDHSAPLLERHLGWAITDFGAFHLKENSGLKDYGLVKRSYGAEWKAKLAEENILDVRLYAQAQVMAADRLARFGLKPPGSWRRPDEPAILIADTEERKSSGS